ncbi:TonB-dependent receptor [Sphingomonas oleivorans]|uniref:TonB-dependent receptor n=2 Tax=Sphingomonas oleivorans TaxID=1735121 RepID=A0A2T5FZ64_9SPHN|nr:TonB-dependent receptor [Sphingomonas oleivorans]
MTKDRNFDAPVGAAAQRSRLRKSFFAIAAGLLSCTAMTSPAWAQDATAADESGQDSEIVVTGALDALPVQDVGSVFGFDKTLVETPRSASTISEEQIERFGITDIYDLVAQAPGTFTNSFFGVGGALDIRGTPGEVYFRGVRRLDNPGNYPTPIGASDRIDIVRGPASPIFGPSKTGGYMNFVPKSARVKGGALLSNPEGEISYTTGSWDRNVLKAQVRGPAKILGSEFGYNLYAEVEDSGSYYRNMSTNQTILQGSFDNRLTDTVRIEFGGMYQKYSGQQNGGWNRLTQDLVDNGTYITGTAKPLDTSGDGQISPAEFNAVGAFSPFGGFGCGGNVFASSITDACFNNLKDANGRPNNYLALENTGTTKLSRKNVLTGKNDVLNNKATTGYFDIIFDPGDGFELKNQLFYDGFKNLNENAYGFSQFHDSWVIEDKIVLSKTFENTVGKFSFQLSPSIRYTKFLHGDDFNFEYFHRVDLTQGYTALSDRLLSTECDCDFANYLKGSYTDLGFAALTDLDFAFGLDLVLGARYDTIHAKSRNVPAKLRVAPTIVSASDTEGAWSWTASASYKLPFGLIPYVTASQQSTVVAGQGAEIDVGNLAGESWVAASKLYEAGIKGSFLDDTLYAALSVYKQKRTDFNVQSITVNQAVETKGLEAEVRWSVNKHLLITGAYSRTNVYNLTALKEGTLFSFFGIEDLKNVSDPTLYLGGQPIGLLLITDKEASKRAGIPENLYSLTASYQFDNGIALSGSVVKVDSVYSGQSQAVKLPAYTLVDLGASYEKDNWLFRVVVKNATNERYFRANFTELFGSTIVLPERPRSFQASVVYKF